MPASPRGAIVRSMRVTDKHTDENGAEITLSVSAPGIVVRLAHIPGECPSNVKREFSRYCRSAGIIATQCEMLAGQFSKKTGKEHKDSVAQATAYQCIGEPSALVELLQHWTVKEWHYALSVKAPMMAQGSGPEKVRVSSGSMFGKPNTLSATATQLAKQTSEQIRTDRKSWGQMSE